MRHARKATRRTQGVFVVLCMVVASAARAQAPEQNAPVQNAPVQNDRVVRGEAPIVAGNAAAAGKRAVADALRQLVERALGELLKEIPMPSPMPAGVAQLKASLANASQKYVRSYRLIEQETEGGVIRVMVEADVNTALLRHELERLRGASATPPTALAPVPAAAFLLVAGTAPAAAMTANALAAAGVGARLDPATSESQLVASAAKQNAKALFVVATSASEGLVRGTNRISVKCNLRSRLFQAGGQTPERMDEERGFAAEEKLARDACFARVTSQVARGLASTLRAPAVAAAFVTLHLDIVDPGPIPILLQALKRAGAVTATEVRHVAANLAEIRVFTRIGGVALGQALLREVAGKLTVTPTQTTNDVLALRVRALESSPLEENR